MLMTVTFLPAQQKNFRLAYQNRCLSINIRKTNIIYQRVPGNNEGPPAIKTHGTTLENVEHFPYLGNHVSQKASIESEIQCRNILHHHILQGMRNQVFNTHNLMEETKVMSSEDHEEIPPKLPQKDYSILWEDRLPSALSSWRPTQLWY